MTEVKQEQLRETSWDAIVLLQEGDGGTEKHRGWEDPTNL